MQPLLAVHPYLLLYLLQPLLHLLLQLAVHLTTPQKHLYLALEGLLFPSSYLLYLQRMVIHAVLLRFALHLVDRFGNGGFGRSICAYSFGVYIIILV